MDPAGKSKRSMSEATQGDGLRAAEPDVKDFNCLFCSSFSVQNGLLAEGFRV